jgi:WD40 repeat protein
VRLWDVETGAQLAQLSGHEAQVFSAHFSADSRFLVTASWDNTACVWNTVTGRLVARLMGHEKAVTASSFSPDGRFILTGSMDQTMILWELSTGRAVHRFLADEPIRSISLSADARNAYVLDDSGGGYVWDLVNKDLIIATPQKSSGKLASFSPSGRFAVLGSDSGQLSLWDVEAAHDLIKFAEIAHAKATAVAWIDDGVIAGDASGSITIYKNKWLFAAIADLRAAACAQINERDAKFTRREAGIDPIIRQIWDVKGSSRSVCD